MWHLWLICLESVKLWTQYFMLALWHPVTTEDNYVWGSLRWKEMARLSCTWSIISCDGLVVVQSMSRVWLCNPTNCSTRGFPVYQQLLELAQTPVHWVCDAIQPSHPLPPSSPPALNFSWHESIFQWVGSLNQVAKVSGALILWYKSGASALALLSILISEKIWAHLLK